MDPKDVKQWEKFSSTAAFNSFMFDGERSRYSQELFALLATHSAIPFKKDDFVTSDKHTIDEMASSIVTLGFFCFLTKLLRPQLLVEIGSFVGFSTCNLGACLPSCGMVYSFEKYEKFATIAKANIKRLSLSDKAEVIVGDAKDTLGNFLANSAPVDLAFIDGNKEDYATYFGLILDALSSNGLIIVDDVFFHGDAVNKNPKTAKGIGVQKLLEELKHNHLIEYTVIPVSNGIALVSKRQDL